MSYPIPVEMARKYNQLVAVIHGGEPYGEQVMIPLKDLESFGWVAVSVITFLEMIRNGTVVNEMVVGTNLDNNVPRSSASPIIVGRLRRYGPTTIRVGNWNSELSDRLPGSIMWIDSRLLVPPFKILLDKMEAEVANG